MTRMRTHKSRYFSVSNETAQDQSISFEALGLLTYCLSKPENWEFHPKQIWKERKCGRDKIYCLFNELIEKFHCIRIKSPNPKHPNLAAEILYEFFDDTDDCKTRIKELEDLGEKLDHGYNRKKRPSDPENQDSVKSFKMNNVRDPNFQDSTSQDDINNRYIQTKENNNKGAAAPPPAVVVSSEEKKRERNIKPPKAKQAQIPKVLTEIDELNEEDKQFLSQYDEKRILLALEFAKIEKPTTTLAQLLKWHCRQNKPPKPNPKKWVPKKCKEIAKTYESSSCEMKISGESVFFIPTTGQTMPIEVKFSEQDVEKKILDLLRKYKFVKK